MPPRKLQQVDYRKARKKLDAAKRVQPTIPENANKRTGVVHEDSHIQSTVMMGVTNTQAVILATDGNTWAQFQSKPSHSGLAISAIENPTHSIAKVKTAYVLSTRETVTFQNDESFIVALPGLHDRQLQQELEARYSELPL